ncbi:MAG: AbrB/MazE/SpoVT family DNA-binding domain-containing protein [Rhizobiaceae bacterium]|nr:AbrB/MazE/SpoVT family DNA-binding domain-containing protein [Rhizobiaceae bacterium]MCV0409052.1 AbrB/MazE/SpoVT family DNA-binding domain-containing protein [Rhizobiaceae bacterium]
MRVTSKGQVTIPKEIRDHLGIEPGSEVEFVVEEGKEATLRLVSGTRTVPTPEESIRRWAERVRGTMDLGGMTGEEYFEWIRGPRNDLDSR